MKVLVTGHLGYIGAHLGHLLMSEGYEVTGVDLHLFQGCEWDPTPEVSRSLRMDYRLLKEEDLAGMDAIIHLAALSNDAMGQLDETLTYSVNAEGTINLAKRAKAAGVRRFIFSGSCAIYGKGTGQETLDEGATVNPLTAYANSKVLAERALEALADHRFHPILLRNATAYGYSPALRIDLVANDLLASAMAYGEVRIHSDGLPWRPLVHCRDIARACAASLHVPMPDAGALSINVGSNKENYQVYEIANLVATLVDGATITYTGKTGPDPRDYRVDFSRLQRLFPDRTIKTTLSEGLKELAQAYRRHNFEPRDFEGSRFYRLRTLIEKGRLNWL